MLILCILQLLQYTGMSDYTDSACEVMSLDVPHMSSIHTEGCGHVLKVFYVNYATYEAQHATALIATAQVYLGWLTAPWRSYGHLLTMYKY